MRRPNTRPSGPKSTWQEQALAIVSGDIGTMRVDLPGLLEWLQDLSWPGAPEIQEFLPKFGNDLIDPVRGVLGSRDDIWIRNVLAALSDKIGKEFWSPLKLNLMEVASHPDDEGACGEAIYLLAKFRLADQVWLRERLVEIKSRIDSEEYERIADEIDLL